MGNDQRPEEGERTVRPGFPRDQNPRVVRGGRFEVAGQPGNGRLGGRGRTGTAITTNWPEKNTGRAINQAYCIPKIAGWLKVITLAKVIPN